MAQKSGNSRHPLEHPIVLFIGLISACVGIFAFITGYENIPRIIDIFNGNTVSSPTREPNSTSNEDNEFTTAPTSSPLARSDDWIVYSKGDMGGWRSIFIVNSVETGEIRLTDGRNSDVDPSWSPDRKHIIFSSERDPHSGQYQLYIMDGDGSNLHQVTSSSGDNVNPSWSPNGDKVVFSSDRNGAWQIFTMNINGSEQTALTDIAHPSLYPAWSPSGDKIAYSSEYDGYWEIYIMNSDGSNSHQLTDGTDLIYYIDCDGNPWTGEIDIHGNSITPAWNPNGNQIAFAGGFENGHQFCQDWDIFIINTDGSNIQRLYMHESSEHYPSWSPDGEFFVFKSAFLNQGADIFIRSVDGSYQKKLFENNDYFTVIEGISWVR